MGGQIGIEMKPQSLILLAVAVSCGLVSMFGVKQVLNRKGEPKGEVVEILAARYEIDAGVPIDDSNTYFLQVPIELCPEDAITSLDQVKDRALKSPAAAKEWLRLARLGDKGQFGVIARVPAGMAAVTIPVDATTTHSGMLEPGNLIDLLLTYDDPEDHRIKKTISVLEFAEVFAVDNSTYGKETTEYSIAKNITLVVKPDQAKAVTHAKNCGKLSTVMRKPGSSDDEEVQCAISLEYLQSGFVKNNLNAPSVARGEGSEDYQETGYRPTDRRNGPQMTPEMLDAERALAAIEAAEAEAAARAAAAEEESDVQGQTAEPEEEEEGWVMEIYDGVNVVKEKVPLEIAVN